MNEFDKLKASVLEQAEVKGQEYYQRAINEIKQEIQVKKDELLKNQEALRKDRLGQVRRQHDRVIQQLANQERQISLLSKQEIIKELFAAAKETMFSWSVDQDLAFLEAILKKHAEDKLTIQFGQKTRDKLSDQDLAGLKGKFPQVELDQASIPLEAGFKLIKDKIDYNYLYADLIADSQKEISAEIANQVYLDE